MHDWWISNADLFEEARKEWGPLHPELYDLEAHAETLLNSELLRAVAACEAHAARAVEQTQSAARFRPTAAAVSERASFVGDYVETGLDLENAERELRTLLQEVVPGVWRLPIFTPHFCRLVLEELAHYEASGIPLRRPNGMNRYGAILDHLGMENSLRYLCRRVLRPMGSMLFPSLISKGDVDHTYGFVVRYRPDQDVSLAEHADASLLTLNLNLGVPGFSGGEVVFRGTRFVDSNPQQMPERPVDFARMNEGDGVLHLGGQFHSALRIKSGERVNLVLWMFGEHGVVRIAPYEERERLTMMDRWNQFAADTSKSRVTGISTQND